MSSFIKIIASNLFASTVFNSVIRNLAHPFIITDNSIKSHEKTALITIDCESGFLKNNKGREWMFQNPEAFQGYYAGIENILDLLKSYNLKATFFLSTQCFSSKGAERTKIINILNRIVEEGHELGLHMHPKEDFAVQKFLKRKFLFSGAKFYTEKELEIMIISSLGLIRKNLGEKIADRMISFRFGNYAIDKKLFPILEKKGFLIDSTICPGCSGNIGTDTEYDWEHYNNPGINKMDGLIEVPITTFSVFGRKRADPSLGALAEVALEKSSCFPFVIMTHSSECTYENGSPTYVLANLENLIRTAKKNSIKFKMLNKFAGGKNE